MSKPLEPNLLSDPHSDPQSQRSAYTSPLQRQASVESLASSGDTDDSASDLMAASTAPTSVSSSSLLSQPNFVAGKNTWLSAYLRVSDAVSPTLQREIALPAVGTVTATATVDHLPGSTLRVSVGQVAEQSAARTVMLQPGESLSAYTREARTLVLDRIAAAPKEHYAVAASQPLQAQVALSPLNLATTAASGTTGTTGMAASLAAAGMGMARSALDGGVTALSEALSGRVIRFSHWTRENGQPVQSGGIAFTEQDEALAGSSVSLAAASLTALPARGWLSGGIESGSKKLVRGMLESGLSMIQNPNSLLLQRLLDAVEPIMLSMYERGVHAAKKAKPRTTTSGQRSSDLFARLYHAGQSVQAVEHGRLDLTSMLPPLSWQGRDAQKTLLQVAPGLEPLAFSAYFADGDDALRAQFGTGAVLSQPYGQATPLQWSLTATGVAAARGLTFDRALLSSVDAAHYAQAQLSADAHLDDGATLSAKTHIALSEAYVTLSQTLGWTPSFARQFAAQWLTPLTGGSAPTDPRLARALRAVGLSALAQAPQEALASVMAAVQSVSLDSLRVHAPSADRLLGAAPTVGADAALSALMAGLPSLGQQVPKLWQAVAADSDMHAEIGLRSLNLPVQQTPLSGMAMGRFLNFQVHRPGTFVVDHAPGTAPQAPTAAPGAAARMAAWIGTAVMTPAVALWAIAAALVHALLWPVRVIRQTPVQRPADYAAEIRIVPMIRTPVWTHKLFGKDLSLSKLLHVRLHGTGPALYERDGHMVIDPARGATPVAPGAVVDAEGRVFGRGELRLFSLPVYRFEAMSLGKLPLGAAARPAPTVAPVPQRRVKKAPSAEAALSAEATAHFYGQLLSGVDARFSPRSSSEATLLTGDDGTVFTRGEEPLSLSVTFPKASSARAWPSAFFLLRGVDLGMARTDAAGEQTAHLFVRGSASGSLKWSPRSGQLHSGSATVSGELDAFGSDVAGPGDRAPTGGWRGHLALDGNRRGTTVTARSQWLQDDEVHRALMDSVGLGPATAWLLPNKARASAHFDLQQLAALPRV